MVIPEEMVGRGNNLENVPVIQQQTEVKVSAPELCGNYATPPVPKNVNTTKEMEVISETMSEGVFSYGLPAVLATVAGTFLMRYRNRQMKASTVEKVILGGLTYYGATTLGMTLGLTFYGPTFNQKILERIPHSDLAREIRKEQAKKEQ